MMLPLMKYIFNGTIIRWEKHQLDRIIGRKKNGFLLALVHFFNIS